MRTIAKIAQCATLLLTFTGAAFAAEPPKAAARQGGEEQELTFERFKCSQLTRLNDNEDPRTEVLVVWLHGYYTGVKGADKVRVLNRENFSSFLDAVMKQCRATPDQLVTRTIDGMK